MFEQTLQTKMDVQLGYDYTQRSTFYSKKNYRNSKVKRTMKTQLGEANIEVSRDRNGEFEL